MRRTSDDKKPNKKQKSFDCKDLTQKNSYGCFKNGFCDFHSKTDPNGSYTGVPLKHGEVPVQDADDL